MCLEMVDRLHTMTSSVKTLTISKGSEIWIESCDVVCVPHIILQREANRVVRNSGESQGLEASKLGTDVTMSTIRL